MIDLARMFSESPGTPGRRQQIPRTHRVDRNAGARSFIERIDDIRVDQGIHLHPDRGWATCARVRDLPGDVPKDAVAQAERENCQTFEFGPVRRNR
jgi:hypothetical protein